MKRYLFLVCFICFPFIGLFLAVPDLRIQFDAALLHTVIYVILLTILNVWLALGTAWWLIFTESRWRAVIEWLVFIPLFIPVMASMFGMYVVLANFGLVGTYVGVGIVFLVTTLPYSIRLAYNAMYVIGRPLLEQTLILSPFRRSVMTLIPILANTIRTIALFTTVIVLSQFVLVQLIGAGLVSTITTNLYQSYSGNNISLALRNTWILIILPVMIYIGLSGMFSLWVQFVKGRLR